MAFEIGQRVVFGRPSNVLRAVAGDALLIAPFVPKSGEVHAPGQFPELDCVRALLPADIIDAAERRAEETGVGAERVLIAGGLLGEEAYLRTLAASLGVRFESLDATPRQACLLSDARLMEAAAAQILPLAGDDGPLMVVAPRSARHVIALIKSNPGTAGRFRFTTQERLRRFVFRHGARCIGERAARALHDAWPALSAAPPRWRHSIAPAAITGTLALAAFLIAPGHATVAFEIMLAVVFLAWMILRLAGTLVGRPDPARPARIHDSELPVYTIMSALYREAAALEGLVNAIRLLDYPPEKLDVKIVVEADDTETLDALARLDPGPPFEVIVAPDIGPRTKPKALNAALPFARGSFTVIYDAEDRPEPDQLRRALDAFAAEDNELACVQACLTIDNTADNWITALFTAEYAGQFDVFLPALAALGMPLPLGGSSNHFRGIR